MYKVLDSRPASGEMLLFEIWKEDQAGLNDEVTTGARLKASPEGNIMLIEYSEYKPTFKSSSKEKHIYKISVPNLIELIKRNSL